MARLLIIIVAVFGLVRRSRFQKPSRITVSQSDRKSDLECFKLKQEIESIHHQRRFRWVDRTIGNAGVLGAFFTILALVWAVYQYRDQQEKNREAAAKQLLSEQWSRDRDFLRPLWERQIGLYFEITELAAAIAVAEPGEARSAATNRLWVLQNGPLVLVAPAEVTKALEQFVMAIPYRGTAGIRMSALSLASVMQNSLTNGASLMLATLGERTVKYPSPGIPWLPKPILNLSLEYGTNMFHSTNGVIGISFDTNGDVKQLPIPSDFKFDP